jgi:hypothetical protein
MSLTNPKAFFDLMRAGLLGPTLAAEEVKGCNAILEAMEEAPLSGEAPELVSFAFHRSFGQIALSRTPIGQTSRGRHDCFLERNASLQAFVERRHSDPVPAASRGEAREILAGNRDCPKAAFVFGALLEGCGPSAVVGRVISRGVDPVDSHFVTRSLSHVSEEGCERPLPPLADAHSGGAVFDEILMARVGASPLDAQPRPVGRAGVATALMTVLRNASSAHVPCIEETAK